MTVRLTRAFCARLLSRSRWVKTQQLKDLNNRLAAAYAGLIGKTVHIRAGHLHVPSGEWRDLHFATLVSVELVIDKWNDVHFLVTSELGKEMVRSIVRDLADVKEAE